MDDEDFLALIELLSAELRGVGAAALADPRHYTWRDGETGEMRQHGPRKRLMLMLEAFGRKLAMEDRATYHLALGRLAETLGGEGPRGAVVQGLDPEQPPVDLAEVPALGEQRAELRRLIDQIREAPPPARGFA